MESFWMHSIACGLAARTIAVYRREPNVERFYIAGLLHEIGRLVIFENLPDLARKTIEIHEGEHKFLHYVEQEVMGFDHAAVGGAILREWRLPDNLVEPVAFHHQPLEARNYPVETAIVHFADIIACAMQLGTSRECYVPSVDPKAWEEIRLPVGQLPAIWNQVDKTFYETIDFFL
jgi:HD-like signal output (HDOD) protein